MANHDIQHSAYLAEVERTRARLSNRNPSLRSQYLWFLDQAEDEGNPAEDRALWRQLADEVACFAADKSIVSLQQDALF